MVLCMIVGCGSKSGRDKGLYFARVPSVVTNQGEEAQELSKERRSRWVSAISRDDLTEEILENDRVCEKHFVSGKAAKSWDKYNVDWVPTLLLGHKKATDRAHHKEAAAKRSERARERELVKKPAFEKRERELELERAAKRQKLDEPGEQVSNLSFEGNESKEKKTTVEAGTQTEEFDHLIGGIKFFTGLPSFDILHNNLTSFQEFIMTLIKLKLDAPHQDLSYRFNVSLSTVSRIFSAWMVALDVRLAPLINWPEREDLWRTMPQCFKYSFGNKTTVIIDCFEVFINRPSNLLARGQTWSSYKHHNTVKVLIGITPQGTISYVSQAWGGRTSDKFLTENCGILNKLLPGDLVLADRGFTIAESVMFQQAQLAIPAFTKGKDQLDPVDVEKTRGIANVRIHVERVIGLLRRKYSILSGILPIDFLISNPNGSQEEATPMIERIINVSAALVNLCPGIVPLD
ncbi:unnamed protein product [Porites lobata]|uniref:THAP-type domain-containing protein n=1 Tax=Porites lobata TaxID=104759 RepID=A0ABN8NAH9_9CNID|nr:unnamed protein product [Porites lobata]